jgi:GDP-L-fucose synthase
MTETSSLDLTHSRILVTGGNGFLGSAIIRNLIGRGVTPEQIVVPRRENDDLRDFAICTRATSGIDLVIHAAAVTGNIRIHLDNPGSVLYDNLIMGAHLMEAARQSGVRKFVSIGSATEYPASAAVPLREETLWDGYPALTHAPYSAAKRMLLVQGAAYREQYGFRAVHLLPTNMYGPGDRLENGFAIPSLIMKIAEAVRERRPAIDIWGSGAVTRDFLYVDDAAAGVIAAAEHYDSPEPVNLGSGVEVTVKALVELLCRIFGFSGTIRFESDKPSGPARRLLDIGRAKEAFGFSPRTSLEQGLLETVTWYRNHNLI